MTLSKAEQAAVALCAAFVLFFAGWFARGAGQAGYYEVTTEHPPLGETTAPPSPTGFLPAPDTLVDLNTASLDDLTGLPGVGQTRAQAILDYRTQNGPFQRIEDVMKVKGVGEGIFQQLEPYITVTIPEGGQTP